MDAPTPSEPRDASVVVARDERGQVALLTSRFPRHGGGYLFLPGGKMEPGEPPEQCAHRELREESGITAQHMRPSAHTPSPWDLPPASTSTSPSN